MSNPLRKTMVYLGLADEGDDLEGTVGQQRHDRGGRAKTSA